MYAEIIPFVRMPHGNTTFTYAVPPELEGLLSIGQFVRIPLRKKAVFGVVASFRSTPPSGISKNRIAPVLAAEETTPSWNKHIIRLLLSYAHLHHCSPSTLAKSFAPEIPKSVRDLPVKDMPPSSFLPHMKKVAISSINPNESQTIVYHSLSERISLLEELLKKKSLLLTDQEFNAIELFHLIKKNTSRNPILWETKRPKNATWNAWNEIKEASSSVITTRSGCFLPLQNLEAIIIDSPESSDHKSWEASPHYDARELAKSYAKLLNIPLIQLSLAPRISNSSSWSILPSSPAPIHSMIHEKLSEPIHADLVQTIKDSYKNQEQTILIKNATYDAGTLRCLDCKLQWLCPNNHGSLHLEGDQLICRSCDHKVPSPKRCPSCGGYRMKAFGLGMRGIAQWIEASGMKVHEITSSTLEETTIDAPSIILTTPYLLKKLRSKLSPEFKGNIIYLHPEDLLFLPDYRANEWFFQTIQWHRSIALDYFQTPLTVQTQLKQEDDSFSSFLNGSIEEFRQKELKTRKLLSYPPFSRIITITIKVTDLDSKGHLGQISRDIQASTSLPITGPLPRYRNKAIYGYAWQMKQIETNSENLDKMLNSLYSKATVELNPEQLL